MEAQIGGGEEQHVPVPAEPTSPADFLASLGRALRNRSDIDTGLADILANHLLTAEPASDAVAKAKDAIVMLAVRRADPPKPEAGGG